MGDFSETIKCVVLNACYTSVTADVLSTKIGCTIGTTSQVQDSACVGFSASFYEAIGFGDSFKKAYEKASHQVPAVVGVRNLHGITANDAAAGLTIVGS